jgi:hypothetical protein
METSDTNTALEILTTFGSVGKHSIDILVKDQNIPPHIRSILQHVYQGHQPHQASQKEQYGDALSIGSREEDYNPIIFKDYL